MSFERDTLHGTAVEAGSVSLPGCTARLSSNGNKNAEGKKKGFLELNLLRICGCDGQ